MSDPASISNEAIEIAGTKSFTKNANTIGVAKFTVTLCAAGTDTDFDGMGLAVGARAFVLADAGAFVLVKRRRSGPQG